MDSRRRSSLIAGLVLVLLGVWLLAVQAMPELHSWFSWPLIIIGVAILLLIIGLISGAPGMAVPVCIVGGIGGLLYWQNVSGDWESWAYAWTLIPGFVGVGILLTGLLGGGSRHAVRGGGWLILVSLVLFSLFGAFFGGLEFLGPYWPLLLILMGLLIFLRSWWRSS